MRALRIAALAFLAAAPGGLARAEPLDLDSSPDGLCDFILDSWVKAEGGLDRFAGIRSYEFVEEVESSSFPRHMTHHAAVAADGYVRVESSYLKGPAVVRVFDGRMGWCSRPQVGMGPLTREGIASLKSDAFLTTALSSVRAYPVRELLASQEAAGRPCFVLGMRTTPDSEEEKWFFDKQSHQLARIERPIDASGAALSIAFSDYGPADGLTLPRTITIAAGSFNRTIRFSQFSFNHPVDEAAFVPTMAQVREMDAVTAILKRHAAVYGNASADARGFRSRVIRMTQNSSATGLTAKMTIATKRPDLVRLQIDIAGMGRSVEGFDGSQGWMESDVQGFHLLRIEDVRTLETEWTSFTLPRLSEAYALRRLVGERIVNGRHAFAVELSDFSGRGGTYYFDRDTGRLLRIVPPRDSDTLGTVVDFGDFHVVHGIEIPFETTISNYAGKTVEKLESVDTDVDIPDAQFQAPPVADR